MIEIKQKIKSVKVLKDSNENESQLNKNPKQILMHENIERPEILIGSTYKIKTPISENAYYITINDIILNKDTEFETRHPFEIFINSKNMQDFQWIVAFTRIISAVFRKGGDIIFLIEELRSVFDPKGGYYKNKKFYSSLISEIGDIIEKHLISINMIQVEEKNVLVENKKTADNLTNATFCPKCQQKTLLHDSGCKTCINCGYSECG